MMSNHLYAIKLDGKTLGIKDSKQLSRLVQQGRLNSESKVFLLEEKRWIPVMDLLADDSHATREEDREIPSAPLSTPPISLIDAVREATMHDSTRYSIQDPAASKVVVPEKSEDFSALVKELDEHARKTIQVAAVQEGHEVDSGRTIHRISGVMVKPTRTTRLQDSAVHNPAKEKKTNWRQVVTVAVAILMIGAMLGFLSSSLLVAHQAAPQPKILQAGNPSTPTP